MKAWGAPKGTQGWLRQHKAQSIWQAISATIMRFVAQQLLPMTAVRAECKLNETQLVASAMREVVVVRDAIGWEPGEGADESGWCGCLRLA